MCDTFRFFFPHDKNPSILNDSGAGAVFLHSSESQTSFYREASSPYMYEEEGMVEILHIVQLQIQAQAPSISESTTAINYVLVRIQIFISSPCHRCAATNNGTQWWV